MNTNNKPVSNLPRLTFPSIPPEDLAESLIYIEMKGYCAVAVLETVTGLQYSVNFIEPLRAKSELERSRYYIEPGLIIVPDTRLETMQEAAISAWESGFFACLLPINASN